MTPELPSEIGIPLPSPSLCDGKRLVFTVTTGRSGTQYLQKVLSCVPGVLSLHEPQPDFADVMRAAQSDPGLAVRFLVERKLPFIQAQDCEIYAETSHLFCKGFLEALLRLRLTPDLIFLTRPHREVALSLARLRTVPGRTANGLKFLLHPEDSNVLPLEGWRTLTDYQLCYWYSLAIEHRSREYRSLAAAAGSRICSLSLAELTTYPGLRRLTEELRLPPLRILGLARYFFVRRWRYNAKRSAKRPSLAMADLSALESEVTARLRA